MTRPTVTMHGVDAGDSYYFWQWVHDPSSEPQAHVMPRADLAPLLHRLDESLPGSTGTETFTTGLFTRYATEFVFSRALSRVALPRALAAQIVEKFNEHGGPVLLRVQPSPSCSRIPWELLTIGDDADPKRLVDYADIVIDPPPDINSGRAAEPAEWEPEYAAAPALYVVDPFTDRVQGPVLSAAQREAFPMHSPVRDNPEPGKEFGRLQLSEQLRTRPSRLFYLGHVASSSSQPGASALLLSDPPWTFGVTDVIEGNGHAIRPLSAFDLIEGTWRAPLRLPAILERAAAGEKPGSMLWPGGKRGSRALGAAIWPMPARVALVACNSGGDLAHPEPFGLVIAMLNAGAGLVTATRWTLPTDDALHRSVPEARHAQPLFDMALAIDDAHRQADPVPVIAEWQRVRLAAWKASRGAQEHSPVFWASLSTYLAPRNPPEPIPADELKRLLEG